MQNDSIETLLLRHYGSAAPAPVGLEEQLCELVRRESAALQTSGQRVSAWNQRRVSRRRVLQLVTFSGAGLSVLALGVQTLAGGDQRRACSV
ncbi:MAG TPA: hypothetical protein VGF67_27625 [Ktedonobacteraceae bacterium]|jgi:hypothetical protein